MDRIRNTLCQIPFAQYILNLLDKPRFEGYCNNQELVVETTATSAFNVLEKAALEEKSAYEILGLSRVKTNNPFQTIGKAFNTMDEINNGKLA